MWHLPSLPHIYSSFFYKFETYLGGENLCKSILGLWYFQGYMFQPGIYGIIKWLFFNVKLTPNRYILHVPEGYRVISFLIWLFRSLHKITIVFFACLIVSISFRLFGCFFFLIQKIAENITHGGFFFVISHLWYFLRDFWPYFFLNENIHVICCWKSGEFKRGDSLINEGILPKARKRKPRRWPGSPLKYKVQSKKQQWVNSSVWNLSYKLFSFSTLKNWHFLLQPWRSRRSNIVWRGHISLSFSNGKRHSGHTFGRNNTVKPRFKDNIFRKICMKRVFGFQQKGTLLFLFTRMAEVNSVENKQLYKTRISNKTVGYFRYLVL